MSGSIIARFAVAGLFITGVAVPLGAQFSPRQLVEPIAQAQSLIPAATIDKSTTGKLTGTWYRQFEGGNIGVTFAEKELKVCATFSPDITTIRLTVTAGYSLAKDGLVHLTITGVNWDVKPDAARMAKFRETLANIGICSETLLDCPFSFRVQLTGLGLMVSDLKTTVDEENESIRTIFLGLFNGMYALNEGETIPPLDSRPLTVALFISTSPETGPVFAGTEQKLAAEIARKLPELARKNKRRVTVIEPALVNTFKIKNPTWHQKMHQSEWGLKLGVDFVLDIQLDKMSLYQPGSLNQLYEGRAEVTVDIYKVMAEPMESKFKYTLSFAYPHDGVLDASSTPQRGFKQDYLEHLAAEISKKQLQQKQFSLVRKAVRNQTFFAPARYVQKSPDSGIVAISENTNVFPTYYKDAARELIKQQVGPSYEIVEQYKINVGELALGTSEIRIVYRKKPIQPIHVPGQVQPLTIPTEIPLAIP